MNEENERSHPMPKDLPVILIRNQVLFPGGLLRLSIGRSRSVRLIQGLLWESRQPKMLVGIFTKVAERKNIVGKKESVMSEKLPEPMVNVKVNPEVYAVGTMARVVQLCHVQGSHSFQYTILVQGISRLKAREYVQQDPYFIVRVDHITSSWDIRDPKFKEQRISALRGSAKELLEVAKKQGMLPLLSNREFLNTISSSDPGELADILVMNLQADTENKQSVLEATTLEERLDRATKIVRNLVEVLKTSTEIHRQVQGHLKDSRREYYLRQKLQAIKEELGESDDSEQRDEIAMLKEKLETSNLPEAASKIAQRELKRLESIPAFQPEHSVLRTYLEWLGDLPWSNHTEDRMNVTEVLKQLNKDHHGLEKVKKRIVEYIAVRSLKMDTKGPIVCLVGPPGVGKTSLGKSIAVATGRAFQRISLGGIRDESEIRGHRRTYIGAMPGNVIHAIKRAAVNNPVILLDEIDKLGSDFRGDPASALLEVLDPAQNSTFQDHYLNTPFDLSKVMFLATANSTDTIPGPLLDRMELIRVSGYIQEEKLEIAKTCLFPRQIAENGLSPESIEITDGCWRKLVSSYTREAGVRQLERCIAAVCRSVAVQLVNWREDSGSSDCREANPTDSSLFPKVKVTAEMLTEILGRDRYREDRALMGDTTGIVTGLAWTSVGGKLLFIEVNRMPRGGSGRIKLTGKLGDIMKESAQLAVSWVRSNLSEISHALGNVPVVYEPLKDDLHVHFPAGAIPKDGPSAGVAITIAVISALSGIPVRTNVAMTGEVTLRGRVLPVGGVKEKILAAHRAGIEQVILPLENKKDAEEDLTGSVNEEVEILFVDNVMDAINLVFGSVVGYGKNAGDLLDMRMELEAGWGEDRTPYMMSFL